MDISIFANSEITPVNDDLKSVLGDTYIYWMVIRDYVYRGWPQATEEWKYPGKNYGWSFRIRDKKRNLIYFLPRKGYFMVAFVFGQKAFEEILKSEVTEAIRQELSSATAYAEGRGIRLEVKENTSLRDIEILIDIKLRY